MKMPMVALWVFALCLACDDEGSRKASLDGAILDASAFDSPVVTDTGLQDAQSAPDASADTSPPLAPGALPVRGYLKTTDSPFAGIDFVYFHLDDFEDGQLNAPGVSDGGSGRKSSSFGPSLIDSIDADDGIPTDGKCEKPLGTCDAWWGGGSLTFTFNASELGGLPTHAGAVWTDGDGQVGFEVFGPDGEIVYAVKPFSEPGFPDNTVNSSTAEDRFFGAYAPGGISAIRLYNTAGGVEVDHLQYGRAR